MAVTFRADPGAVMLITGDHLFYYYRCPRRPFLDAQGTAAHNPGESPLHEKLNRDHHDLRTQLLRDYAWQAPQADPQDWAAAHTQTLALMAQGVAAIHRGVLTLTPAPGITYLGRPDLLVRRPGASRWGNWHYQAVDIRLGQRPKPEYQGVAAFHAWLLSELQDTWPTTGLLWLPGPRSVRVRLADAVPAMHKTLVACTAILQAEQAPEVFISRSRCQLCPWLGDCSQVAQAQQHLSLVPGVTALRYAELRQLGIATIPQLASQSPHYLDHQTSFGLATVTRLVRQAQAIQRGHALPLGPFPALPQEPVELFFDIEAEPHLDCVYLHGVLVVKAGRPAFHGFLAPHPQGEGEVWQQFVDLVLTYPAAPIFHFCPFETQTIQRLGDRYGTPRLKVQAILNRCVDLHAWVTRHVVLPVDNYSLKAIARWLGFRWRHPRADGAQSIWWYNQWLSSQNPSYLEALQVYNEDDCQATYRLKTWLDDFHQATAQSPLQEESG
ncbi:MAG: TM0106 family RecB-like putative nuclease [Gloeomargaritaceae cyanobacterium C42_A2020_066]|nr:TM0106 family RecB-like putative nuclease [Gloeomargaritaceae cyanobacterium C42_A2020_066]